MGEGHVHQLDVGKIATMFHTLLWGLYPDNNRYLIGTGIIAQAGIWVVESSLHLQSQPDEPLT